MRHSGPSNSDPDPGPGSGSVYIEEVSATLRMPSEHVTFEPVFVNL
jgi:hypothetical protein